MAKVITITNHKGGVGKTTTTATLCSILASKGYKVLAIDTDEQANLTACLPMQDKLYYSLYQSYERDTLYSYKVRDNLDIVPCDNNINAIAKYFQTLGKDKYEYHKFDLYRYIALIEREKNYDYILIDTPPNLDFFTESALLCTDYVLIPMTAEALPFKGFINIQKKITEINKGRKVDLLGVVITRYEKSTLASNVIEAFNTNYPNLLLKTMIRKNVDIATAPLTGKTIDLYKPTSNGAKDYEALANEIIFKTQD